MHDRDSPTLRRWEGVSSCSSHHGVFSFGFGSPPRGASVRGVSAIRGFSPFCGPERGLRNRERIGTLDSGGKVPLLSDLGTIGTHSTQYSIVGHLISLHLL